MEYKIKIDYKEVSDKEYSEVPLDKENKIAEETKSNVVKETPNRSNDMLKTIRRTATVYAFGRQLAQLGVNVISTNNSIRGNTLKAERLQTSFSNATNNIGLGLGIGLSVATGNPLVIAMTAYSLAQRAFNLAIETRKYQAEISLERYTSQYYQSRLVKDISEVR